MAPEVTAVITTHARPQLVREALASIHAETHHDVECVVVDGGTFEPRGFDSGRAIRVLRGHGLGVGRARNVGLTAARGEFVIFLDDDDVALPHRIATLLDTAKGGRFDPHRSIPAATRVPSRHAIARIQIPSRLGRQPRRRNYQLRRLRP